MRKNHTDDEETHVHTCNHCEEEESESRFFTTAKALKNFTPISGMLLFLGFVSSFSLQVEFTNLFYLLSILAGSVFVVQSAIRGLIRQRFLNISFLVVIAALGAIYIGEYGEAAAVVFLFSLGEFFESYGVERSRRAVQALLQKSPKKARLKNGTTVLVSEVSIGDVVMIKPGEQVPLDGVIVFGNSALDEASITGESVPVDKSIGDAVFASTLSTHGYLEVQVTKLSKDSTFAKIIELIEKAQASRAPTQSFIDNFARYYTPLVVVVALLVAVVPTLVLGLPFEDWLYRAITLLVIACPCALVIATPVAIASAIGGASRHGILIKGGKYLEKLASVKAVAFDKTRTLTYGRHTVTDVIVCGSHSEAEVLADAAGIEAFSSHPLAEAITDYAKSKGIDLHVMEAFENVAGKGSKATCTICHKENYIGNKKMLDVYGVPFAQYTPDIERLEKEGKTVVLIAEANELIGIVAISDEVRTEAGSVISSLSSLGVSSVMLTGDNVYTAEHVAKQVGITEAHASLLPEDKVSAVESLKQQYKSVAMVGDGVNDAPSLVTSDVGFAIGAGCTDAAIESADITLLSGELTTVPKAIRLARRTMKTIHVNVALALGIKALFLVMIPFGMTNLVFAIAADSGMALVVILNSLRLFKVK